MCVCVPSPLVSEVHAAEKKRECSRRLDAVAPKPSVASAGQGRELGRPERAEKTCCRAGRRVEALPSWAECEPALSRQRTHHPTAEIAPKTGARIPAQVRLRRRPAPP
ncbi:unnamed protein product [Prorocentrum cordatum]|uniref:Uncharacterized protein n=1 Tax=Prorocentrum cordatum TaxID=2364126 RepID=A0ABN9Y6I2_9DINO|nr:unnamed protein product [Polarella glacialis]